jgi:hypothetical protein
MPQFCWLRFLSFSFERPKVKKKHKDKHRMNERTKKKKAVSSAQCNKTEQLPVTSRQINDKNNGGGKPERESLS